MILPFKEPTDVTVALDFLTALRHAFREQPTERQMVDHLYFSLMDDLRKEGDYEFIPFEYVLFLIHYSTDKTKCYLYVVPTYKGWREIADYWKSREENRDHPDDFFQGKLTQDVVESDWEWVSPETLEILTSTNLLTHDFYAFKHERYQVEFVLEEFNNRGYAIFIGEELEFLGGTENE